MAAAALDRFCMTLGSVAGDIALAQGAKAVIIAGGLGRRLVDVLPRSGFASRFMAKGRFELNDGRDPGQSDYSSPAWPVRRRRGVCRGTQPMKDVELIMTLAPVIPVLIIDDVAHARPIAEALVAGGLCALEVTLRTPAALEVIREMAKVEGAVVGAGTVLNEHDLYASVQAGARFIVSPGLTESISRKALASGIPFLPGIATAGDIMRGLDIGLSRFKFFPAIAAGGIPALRALSSPFRAAASVRPGASRRRTLRSGSRSTRFRAWEEAGLSERRPRSSRDRCCREKSGTATLNSGNGLGLPIVCCAEFQVLEVHHEMGPRLYHLRSPGSCGGSRRQRSTYCRQIQALPRLQGRRERNSLLPS